MAFGRPSILMLATGVIAATAYAAEAPTVKGTAPWPEPVEKAKLSEAIHYVLDDKREVRLFRDDLYSLRMFASLRASASDPWPKAVKTTIADSPSLSCAGRLPDGQFFLIGNHIAKHWRRDPLTLALSRDGLDFDRAWAIRSGAPALRHKGMHKGVGYQYPGATVVGDDLWVAYSIGKEDIAVTRIPIVALAGK
jgi:BNR repeat protein